MRVSIPVPSANAAELSVGAVVSAVTAMSVPAVSSTAFPLSDVSSMTEAARYTWGSLMAMTFWRSASDRAP